MELGIYHEFPVLPGRSQAECFAAGFDIVDASEEYGLDVMWLAELHFDQGRGFLGDAKRIGQRKQTARPRRQPAGPWYRDCSPHRKDQDRDQRAGAAIARSAGC